MIDQVLVARKNLINRWNRDKVAGFFIAVALTLVILQACGLNISKAWAGSVYWIAAILLWTKLGQRNRIQSLILFGIGTLCISVALIQGRSIDFERLLTGNSALISMLIAVSFLAMVSRPESEEQLPRGKRAISSTLLAVHLFGSVINISSIFIIGDRISQKISNKHELSKDQTLVLVRGFSVAAFWSPFFAAMAVALSYAPELKIISLWSVGMPLAGCAMLITFWQISRRGSTQSFTGYPMHYGGLILPITLAIGVFAIRYVNSDISILSIITILAPLLTILVLMARHKKPAQKLGQHVSVRLPQMANELMLFQAASVLGFGLQLITSDMQYWLPFSAFGAVEASLLLAVIVTLALIGIHPIISIAALGPLLLPLAPNHTLLALVFLGGWAMGSAVGPLSGMNLAMQGRYGIDSFKIMRWNLGFTLVMFFLTVLALFSLEHFIL